MVEHRIQSLRKAGGLLQEVSEHWLAGARVEVPSECGSVVLERLGEWTALSQPPELEDEKLSAVMTAFWPGPLCVRFRQGPGWVDGWLPHHPLLRALLERTGPAACRRPGASSGPADIRLIWKLPLLPLTCSHLDASSRPWRWLRSGAVERRAVEWVGGQTTLLSE